MSALAAIYALLAAILVVVILLLIAALDQSPCRAVIGAWAPPVVFCAGRGP